MRTVLVATLLLAQTTTSWHLPVNIRVLKDVPVQSTMADHEERGVLSSWRGDAFVIPKGQTFQMIAVRNEGGCRIQFESRQRDVSSCPWLQGFRDHLTDIFIVIPAGK